MSIAPNVAERARDELTLSMLNCWEEGWSPDEIARAHRVTRNVPLGVIFRVQAADEGALMRRFNTERQR